MGEGESDPFFSRPAGLFCVVSHCLIAFFSSLDRRKEAKEDQGVRDACQVGLVPGKVPSPGRGRQGRQPSWPGTFDYRTILATISLSSVRKAEAS